MNSTLLKCPFKVGDVVKLRHLKELKAFYKSIDASDDFEEYYGSDGSYNSYRSGTYVVEKVITIGGYGYPDNSGSEYEAYVEFEYDEGFLVEEIMFDRVTIKQLEV